MGVHRDTTKATAARQAASATRLMAALQAIRRIDRRVKKSASEVARILNQQGVPTRRGSGEWTARAVLDVRPLLGKGFKMPHHKRAAREKSRRQNEREAGRAADLAKCPLDARLSKRLGPRLSGGRGRVLAYVLEDGTAWFATGQRRGKPLAGSDNGRSERERSRRRYTEKLRREDKLEEKLVPLRTKPASPAKRHRVKPRSEQSLAIERAVKMVLQRRREESERQAPVRSPPPVIVRSHLGRQVVVVRSRRPAPEE